MSVCMCVPAPPPSNMRSSDDHYEYIQRTACPYRYRLSTSKAVYLYTYYIYIYTCVCECVVNDDVYSVFRIHQIKM